MWLARFVLPHEPALRSWLRGKRHLPIDGDDVIQESYAILAALESVSHIQNPKAYFFQTANSLILRDLRRARVVSIRAVDDLAALDSAAEDPSPEDQAAGRQELELLSNAIDKLPPQCREAFRLRKIEGYSQHEIAERMGIAESTVEKHVAKAVRSLMDIFGRGGTRPVRASKIQRPGESVGHAEARDE